MSDRKVAIVGGETPLGKEFQQLLSEKAPLLEAELFGGDAESAILTERDGEPTVINPLTPERLAEADAVVLAASAESCREVLERLRTVKSRPPLISLTDCLEDWDGVALRAPLVDPPDFPTAPGAAYQIAHPAAIVLTEFFRCLRQAGGWRRAVVHVFEPASERGKKGINELHQQTVNLLSFRNMPKDVFDAQLSFAMLPAYGRGARVSLESIEARLRRHVETLFGRAGAGPLPSLRLIQAPVFHGHSISVWAEFDAPAEANELAEALSGNRIDVRGGEDEAGTNVSVAGQEGMIVSRIETDPAEPKAAWFWIVADNHRVSAENAVLLAQLLAGGGGVV